MGLPLPDQFSPVKNAAATSAAACPPTPASRRDFLALASGCVFCGAFGLPAARAATDRPIDVGTLADYPRDEISEKHIQYDVFVIRHRGKIFAITAVCPHKSGYLLRSPQKSDTITCSGHDANFTPEGIPTKGPVRRGLIRYAIAVNDQGRIMVDTSRQFPQPQWEDKASFVAAK